MVEEPPFRDGSFLVEQSENDKTIHSPDDGMLHDCGWGVGMILSHQSWCAATPCTAPLSNVGDA